VGSLPDHSYRSRKAKKSGFALKRNGLSIKCPDLAHCWLSVDKES
jgi:hypothetical protein